MKQSKKQLKRNLTADDLQAIGDVVYGIVDKQVATLASKKDLQALETRFDGKLEAMEGNLKDYIHQGVTTIMNGMDNLSARFVEKDEFQKLVEWAKIVGEKVGVKPKI